MKQNRFIEADELRPEIERAASEGVSAALEEMRGQIEGMQASLLLAAPVWTERVLALLAGVKTATVWDWHNQQGLPGNKRGRTLWLDPLEVKTWALQKGAPEEVRKIAA